ncbi:MAG TPA: heavy metal-responsive transcriptional regulator [Acidimicrobiales bacterium]
MTTQRGYRIAEVASLSGYSPPTLRYYEDIGLLPSPQRGANGYRVYDEAIVARLGFITRAKRLGCSLEEIGTLLPVWDAGECAPVQHGLRGVVATKIADAESRIAELTAFVTELQRSEAVLSSYMPEGPCDDDCGCNTTPERETTTASVALTTKPAADSPAIACTLGRDDVATRIDEWRALLAQVRERTPVDDGIRLAFGPDTSVESVARLAAAEQDCCRFFSFALTVDQRGVALEVRAPADGQDVLQNLFGTQT